MQTLLRNAALSCALLALPACSGEPAPPSHAPTLRAPEHGPVPDLPVWSDDLPTEAKSELGRALFHDVRLSGSHNTSCDRCHIAATSLQDNTITSVPDSSYPEPQPHLQRNTTSMLNIVYAPILRWDGSSTDLVDSLVLPLAEPNMNLGKDLPSAQIALKTRLTKEVPGYAPLFQTAFDQDIGALEPPAVWRLAGRALRAFLRKAVSRDSAFDRWNAGDDSAMSEAAVRGFDIFQGRGKCASCHTGPLFTDFAFHNVSTSPPSLSGERADEGRFVVTGEERDRGAFLTPTLRSAIGTAPFFHDGSSWTMIKAIHHLTSPDVLADPNHDLLLDPPPQLDDTDIGDLIELIRALRGEPVGAEIGPPENMP